VAGAESATSLVAHCYGADGITDALRHGFLKRVEQERFQESTIARVVERNRRLIVFHRLRHPQSLSDAEIDAFVQKAAPRENDRAEAARAIRFLYNRLLERQLPSPSGFRESAGAPAPTKDGSATEPRAPWEGEPRPGAESQWLGGCL
jgi:hypothetical protein